MLQLHTYVVHTYAAHVGRSLSPRQRRSSKLDWRYVRSGRLKGEKKGNKTIGKPEMKRLDSERDDGQKLGGEERVARS